MNRFWCMCCVSKTRITWPEITWSDCKTSLPGHQLRRLAIKNGLFTVVVWMQMKDHQRWQLTVSCEGEGGVEGRWIGEKEARMIAGERQREGHTHTHTERERERERERFVLVNGWSVWLAFRDETRDCGLSGARSDNSLAWWPSFSHGYLYQIVVESLELSCRCQYAINYLFGSLRGSGSKTKCMSWKHNLR